ncbi:MAG: hypothetical protein JNK07_09515 [Alphaproteobacteria bacterium]|nr:hypothetical protein [Alphaproteobacteria bacterium]
MSDGWDRVRAELDVWAAQRRIAQFWWRDDDAQDTSDQLKAMLAVARVFDVTIGLSAIPSGLSRRLVTALARAEEAQMLVHGFAHTNHADAGRAKREMGGKRPLDEIVSDMKAGLALARDAFGARVLPVLVPPWNRIAPGALTHLPKLGYRGISTWKPRLKPYPVPGLLQINTHLDLVDWRRGRVIKDERLIAGLLLRKLRWRREARARASEPLGLLTHHAYWTPAMERIVVRLLEVTREHPGSRWHSPRSAFGL